MEFIKHNHESKGTLGPSTPIKQLTQTVHGGASEIQVAVPKDTADAGSYFAQEEEEEAGPEEDINSVQAVPTNSESACYQNVPNFEISQSGESNAQIPRAMAEKKEESELITHSEAENEAKNPGASAERHQRRSQRGNTEEHPMLPSEAFYREADKLLTKKDARHVE